MSYEELLSNYKGLDTDHKNTKSNYQDLQSDYKNLNLNYQTLEQKYENQKLELANLKRMIFGSRREKTLDNKELEGSKQCSIFDEVKEVDEELQNQVEKNVEELTVYKKKNKRKTVAGIKKSQLKDTQIEIIEYKLDPEVKCPECESELQEISKEIVRKEIKYIPAKIIITNYAQHTYKCKKCGTKESENVSSTFVKSEIPKALLAHSFASPSLAAEVIYNKYYLGVPLYRQEKMWDDKGLVLPRNMMANWNIKIKGYYLENLYNLMLKKIKEQSEVLHCDETTIQCNKEAGRKASSNSYMWVLCSGEREEKKGILFQYAQSRSQETAKKFLNGYKGILVTDGYAGYNNIENIIHAECWAHCRRYFYDSIPLLDNKELNISSLGYIGVKYCDKLFEIEREIALLKDDKKLEVRQEKSSVILEEFFNWIEETKKTQIILNNKLSKAMTYALNQKKELVEFIKDVRIPLTNSLAERAVRPFAVHRKNWLFADSVEGAKANGVYYSLIESAKINKLNIGKYIKYLLEEIPQMEDERNESVLEKYLPWSKELPEDILNYQGEYEELKLDKEKSENSSNS